MLETAFLSLFLSFKLMTPQESETAGLLDEDSQSILNIIRDTTSTLSSESCDYHVTSQSIFM